MSDKLKIGIIGVGHMGQFHVNVAKQVADSTIVGIYDADPARVKLISEKYEFLLCYTRGIDSKC